ncbi:MAG: response regulator [Anaerolineae bacterium]
MGKVLVVDDAAYVRAKTVKLLEEYGYETVEACDGAEAVRRYRAVKPDVVLMDITMPVMDGVQAVREIRKEDPNARIVMCSALGQQSMIVEALKAGARDFILKPYQPDRLLTAVRNLL